MCIRDSFPADDAALHRVVGQRHHRNGGFRHLVRSHPLDGVGDEGAGPHVRFVLELGLNLRDLDPVSYTHLEQKYFGIANSDGHNSAKMGDPYIKTEMDNLTYENVHEILANGSYYGSNGPEIRYNIEGVGMGETLTIKESGKADFNITAFDPNYDLVNVKLIKNVITGLSLIHI